CSCCSLRRGGRPSGSSSCSSASGSRWHRWAARSTESHIDATVHLRYLSDIRKTTHPKRRARGRITLPPSPPVPSQVTDLEGKPHQQWLFKHPAGTQPVSHSVAQRCVPDLFWRSPRHHAYDQCVDEIDEGAAHQRHDQERAGRGAVLARDGAHV